MTPRLTHIDGKGHAKMVDVGEKPPTERFARAGGHVRMKAETMELIKEGSLKKGDVLTIAQTAAIMAAKRTSDLIPLCHPIPITFIEVDFQLDSSLPGIRITSSVKSTASTGVEMEALMAVSIAALTIYDMTKAAEKTMQIQNIHLIEKHGGRSGDIYNEYDFEDK